MYGIKLTVQNERGEITSHPIPKTAYVNRWVALLRAESWRQTLVRCGYVGCVTIFRY